eukprot:CAMPEP_0113899360 /NCGR_PEP_ID=MMETSP0780_2-20120614/19977_1 /TAXON_ID=652834 /ORGANISM="Palpitomonas bilix" /LENGTH=259 /DNA_ID=CAMNT_0000891497 /DNA_START=33 /DNA_END=812 /DNA_ORIENTATION=- /assembly_acc=CAM_ASM_000599
MKRGTVLVACVAAMLAVAASMPVPVHSGEKYLVRVKGPGFEKVLNPNSEREEDRIFAPHGMDFVRAHKQRLEEAKAARTARSDEEGFDPSIIWQIGEDIWNWIESNKPVANISTDWGGAVPQNVSDWRFLAGWKDGVWSDNGNPWEIEFKSIWGGSAAKVSFTWSYKYGAQTPPPQVTGAYLAEAMPVVGDASAKVSVQMYCTTKVFEPMNYGTYDNPVGGIDLEIDCKASGDLKASALSCHVVIKGDNTHDVIMCSTN